MDYFTADTHFSSERTLELSQRPFVNVSQMDNCLVENWNETITKRREYIFHLGDFGNYNLVSKLDGNITLILGNYEIEDMKKLNMTFEQFKKYLLNLGFYAVIENFLFYEHQDLAIKLVHRPEDSDKNAFNLFGHVHKLCMIKKYGLNVGIDCHNFKPLSIEQVMWYKNAIDNHYDNNVFE